MQKFINKIVLGDCLDIMESFSDDSIDMVLCDLPYGTTARQEWDTVISCDKLWEQYKRICKPNSAIILTAIQPFATHLINSNLDMFRYDLIWVKNKVTGFLNAKKMPLRRHEHVLIFYKEPPIYNPQKTQNHKPVNNYTKHIEGKCYGKTKIGISGGGQTDRYPTSVLEIPVVNNDSQHKIHPTQKPVLLFEYLIRTYTDKGMVVLDNCIGSGTTAIAAINSQRKYIGIEKSPQYYALACDRVKSFRQYDLFL